MRLLKSTLSTAAFFAVQSLSRSIVKESHAVPASFVREGDAPLSHPLRLQLLLKQNRFGELERHLSEISNPDHTRYGKYLSGMELIKLARPDPHASAEVLEWLSGHIDVKYVETNAAGDMLTLLIPVAQAEAMLEAKFSVFRHTTDGTRLVRSPQFSIPEHLHEHVVTVQPTTSFLRNAPQMQMWQAGESHTLYPRYSTASEATINQACNASAITPLCLRELYGTIDYEPQVPGKNRLGLANYRNQVNNRSDIAIFLQKYRPEAVSAAQDFQLISVNGGTVQQTPLNETQLRILLGGEGDLDAEYLLSLAWPTPLTSWSTAGAPSFVPDADSTPHTEIEPYLTWLDYVLQQNHLPQVISNSYADDEQTVPPAYAHAVCAKFAQLAARGVTVLTGSGDGGVGGVQPGGACLSNKDNKTTQFIPLFPATCPYVTSVGGTADLDPEVAAYDPRIGLPVAQAVEQYLTTMGDQFKGLYNASGRAYPDIAAHATKYVQIWDGTQLIVDGTSAATPTMAAIISLVNDALLAAGRPVLGWLNPWLYKRGKNAFVDITSGSASGCNTTGFPATEGWDAVTGFGTPRFDRLLKAVNLDPTKCKGYRERT